MTGYIIVASCGCAVKKQTLTPDTWVHVSDQASPTVWDTSKAAEVARQHVPGVIDSLSRWNAGMHRSDCGGHAEQGQP